MSKSFFLSVPEAQFTVVARLCVAFAKLHSFPVLRSSLKGCRYKALNAALEPSRLLFVLTCRRGAPLSVGCQARLPC